MYLRVKYVFMTLESDLVLSNAIKNNSKSDVFCIPEIFRTNVSNQLSTKSPLKFVFSRCEFTNLIL